MFGIGGAAGPIVRAGRVELRPPGMADFEEWAELRERSRHFLRPWEPIWPADELTRTAFRRRLRRHAREAREDTSYAFLLRFAEDGEQRIVGGLTLSNVRRGVTQSCAVGYWMGERYAGRGLMTDAVRAAAGFAFGTLRLHRLEAACLPHNAASIRLLEKVGFRREGYARRYLCIAGIWQDHLLYALLADELPFPLTEAAPVRPAEAPARPGIA